MLKIPCRFRGARVCSDCKEDSVDEVYREVDSRKAQNSEDSDASQLSSIIYQYSFNYKKEA